MESTSAVKIFMGGCEENYSTFPFLTAVKLADFGVGMWIADLASDLMICIYREMILQNVQVL
jgi:hypothetical protein